MNYLAHLFLAGDSAESLLGNLAGDFVKGPLHDRFTPAVARGIMEHRKIDAFTDTHPDVAHFRRVIAAEQGHYARVISDVFFDHFLVHGWGRYAEQPIEEFLATAWARLDPLVDAMPERLRRVYPRMRNDGWMLSYGNIDGIWTALYHLSRRFSREPRLEMSTHLLIDARQELEGAFERFLPAVIDYARGLRESGQSSVSSRQ